MLIIYLQVVTNKIKTKNNHLQGEKYEKKLNSKSKVVKVSLTGSNINKYSELNTVARYVFDYHLSIRIIEIYKGKIYCPFLV